jgi:hypothetical protein
MYISHPTNKANFTYVQFSDLEVWFSYSTVIAFRTLTTGYKRRNRISHTTAKHMNMIEGEFEELGDLEFEITLRNLEDRIIV